METKTFTKDEIMQALGKLASEGELTSDDCMGIVALALRVKDDQHEKFRDMELDVETALIGAISKPATKFGGMTREQFVASKVAPHLDKMRFSPRDYVEKHLVAPEADR